MFANITVEHAYLRLPYAVLNGHLREVRLLKGVVGDTIPQKYYGTQRREYRSLCNYIPCLCVFYLQTIFSLCLTQNRCILSMVLFRPNALIAGYIVVYPVRYSFSVAFATSGQLLLFVVVVVWHVSTNIIASAMCG